MLPAQGVLDKSGGGCTKKNTGIQRSDLGYEEMFPHLSFILFYALATNRAVRGLDCFKCVSLDHENPACEDPFHNNYTADLLESPCMSSRKNRNGLFPATACIKLNGVFEATGQSMVVRSCALDSGTLTVDTEIVRMSHCGGFYFEDRYVRGCLQSCFEDACNAAAGPSLPPATLVALAPSLALVAHLVFAR